MGEAWTDERLDDMNRRMEAGFSSLHVDVGDVRWEIGRLNGRVDRLRDEVTGRIDGLREELTGRDDGLRGELHEEIRGVRREIDNLRGEMNDRFDAMRRLIIQAGGGMFATMVVGFISVVVALG